MDKQKIIIIASVLVVIMAIVVGRFVAESSRKRGGTGIKEHLTPSTNEKREP